MAALHGVKRGFPVGAVERSRKLSLMTALSKGSISSSLAPGSCGSFAGYLSGVDKASNSCRRRS